MPTDLWLSNSFDMNSRRSNDKSQRLQSPEVIRLQKYNHYTRIPGEERWAFLKLYPSATFVPRKEMPVIDTGSSKMFFTKYYCRLSTKL